MRQLLLLQWVLLLLSLLLGTFMCTASSPKPTEQWAILVTGSKTYDNYRHHADTAHAHHRIAAAGIPANHIVSLQYNDVPTDPQNPYPGTLFNKATGKRPGVDVNKGFGKNYTGAYVTREAFLGALLCTNTSTSNNDNENNEVINGDSNDHACAKSVSSDATLFIFWAGHGSDGMLLLPDMSATNALDADTLVKGLRMAKHGVGGSAGFSKIVMMVEACDSGSMFSGLLTAADSGIYAVTAAKGGENSYPQYCCNYFRPPSCTVKGQDVGSCLGDLFSVALWQDADSAPDSRTLKEAYTNAKEKTRSKDGAPGSTVEEYGDLTMGSLKLSVFIGEVGKKQAKSTSSKVKSLSSVAAASVIPRHDDGDGHRPNTDNAATSMVVARKDLVKRISDLVVRATSPARRNRTTTLETIPPLPTRTTFWGPRGSIIRSCYRRLVILSDKLCGPPDLDVPVTGTSLYPTMLQACRQAAPEEIIGALLRRTCNGHHVSKDAADESVSTYGRGDDESGAEFARWAAAYGRHYDSPAEAATRRKYFEINADARRAAAASSLGAIYDTDEFSDWSPAELSARLLSQPLGPLAPHGADIVTPAQLEMSCIVRKNISDNNNSIDWVSRGYVTPPTSQGRCATCWSFSATADVEGTWALAGHPLVKLSEQQLIDCGGGGDYGMGAVIAHGQATIKVAPLANHSDPNITGCRQITNCSYVLNHTLAHINGTTCLKGHDVPSILSMLQHGPMSVSVNAAPFNGYKGGIINCSGTGIDHAVTLVGYGTEADGQAWWKVKNSWGPAFGEGGYARLNASNGCLRGPCKAYIGAPPRGCGTTALS